MQPDKRIYPSLAQKRRLFGLLEADGELRQGKFSSSFSRKEAEHRWNLIAEEVNSIPGVKKNWKEWKKTWQDIKSKTKKKQSAINRAVNVTGGGPPPLPISEEESIILRSISESSLIGHQDSQESAVEFIDLMDAQLMPPPKQSLEEGSVTIQETLVATGKDNDQICMPPPEQTLEEGNSSFMETPVAVGKGKRKTAAVKRLQQSTEVARALQETLKEKNEIKKNFYEKYLVEMGRQTDALLLIASNLSHP